MKFAIESSFIMPISRHIDEDSTKEEMISLISWNIFMESYPLKTVLKGDEWKTRRVFAPRFRFSR